MGEMRLESNRRRKGEEKDLENLSQIPPLGPRVYFPNEKNTGWVFMNCIKIFKLLICILLNITFKSML